MYVLGLYLVIADLDHKIRFHLAPFIIALIQRKDRHFSREELLEALHLPVFLARPFPAVLIMHIEYQAHGPAFLHHADEQQAGEKCFTRTALAEHSVGPFNQLFHVDADPGLHIQGCAYVKSFGIFLSKNQLYVPLRGQLNSGEVRRHCLGGLRPFRLTQYTPADSQHRQYADLTIGGCTGDHFSDERVGNIRRHNHGTRVYRLQAHIRDHAKKALLLARYGHIPSHRNIFHRPCRVQLHLHPLGQ